VLVVDLLGGLGSREASMFGVDHHHSVALLHVRAVGGLVLALQQPGDLCCKPSNNLQIKCTIE